MGGEQVEGRRAVEELLSAGRRPVRRVWMVADLDPSPQLDAIERLAARRRIPLEMVARARLEGEARTDAPQGVIAWARPISPVPLAELVEVSEGAGGTRSPDTPRVQQPAPPPFLVVVAGVTDPHNLGAILRSAECAGATGVVLPRHRNARISPTVTKVAAGAVEHLAFALAGGVPTALEQLRRLGVRTLGLAGEAKRSLYDVTLGAAEPVALVLGGEAQGLAPLVRKRCDEVVAIPQHGTVPSLNVGVAGAVACFEVARRRLQADGRQ